MKQRPAKICSVTMYPKDFKAGRGNFSPKCGKSLAPGARFCAKHEADRIRLSK